MTVHPLIARGFPQGKGRRWPPLDAEAAAKKFRMFRIPLPNVRARMPTDEAAEAAMTVSGEDAKNWDAVRRDSMLPVNKGPLIKCDDQTGEVQWQDRDGEQKVTLGPHAVVLVRKGRG